MKKGDTVYANKHKVQIVEMAGNGEGAIVQEIHVDANGKEFPAGPTFFQKKLVAELEGALTWYGKASQEEEDGYAKRKKELESLRREIDIQIKANREHLSNLMAVGKVAHASLVQRVIDFLAGDIRYVAIIGGHNGYEIVPFVDAITNTDTWHFKRYDGLKLLTLTGGRSNGKKQLNWNINEYGDGSGRNSTVAPCKTKKEAAALIQADIDARNADGRTIHIESAIALGCVVPEEYFAAQLAKEQQNRTRLLAKKDTDLATILARYDATFQRLEALRSKQSHKRPGHTT